MKCLRCKVEMTKAKMIGDMYGIPVHISQKEGKSLFGKQRKSEVDCHVCPKCGHIELVASSPQVFAKK